MAYSYVYLESAQEERERIVDYLLSVADGPSAAGHFLDELDKLLGPVDKSILAPNGGAKGIYALQEPRLRVPRNPAREAEEAKERAKKKAAFRAAMIKRNTK